MMCIYSTVAELLVLLPYVSNELICLEDIIVSTVRVNQHTTIKRHSLKALLSSNGVWTGEAKLVFDM